MTLLQTYHEMQAQLTQLSFFLILLPALLFFYYLTPARWRPVMLLLQSLLLYARSQSGLLLLVFSVALDYAAVCLMRRFDDKPAWRRAFLWFSVVKSIALIAGYGAKTQLEYLPQLLGLHIYTLSGLSCVVDVYRRELQATPDPIRFGAYCCFFPRLYAGPLQPYGEFAASAAQVRLRPGQLLLGLGQAAEGVFKAAVLGGGLYALYLSAGALDQMTMLSAWLRVLAFALALYFTLSGFGDMAQGIGRMYGLALPRNFYYPYQSRNVQDFFDRFNITVGSFLNKTVYDNLRSSRDDKLSDCLNILLVCMLGGLWFGLRLNYLLWGVYLALFIILERYVYPRLLVTLPTLFCRIGTFCVTLAGFTIFMEADLPRSARLVQAMFRLGSAYDSRTLYLLSSNWLLLAVSCLLATNGCNLLVTKLRRALPRISAALFLAVDAVIFLLFIALRQGRF